MTVTFARPERHNALSSEMISELTKLADSINTRCQADRNLRALIVTGEGKSFSAGGDLNWMRIQQQATTAERRDQARSLAHMLRALNDIPLPVIGKVQGQAFGGGVGIMSVCDTVIAADHCRFGLTEARLGLIPATISPYVHARIGSAACRHLFSSAQMFDVGEAQRWGLVTASVAAADLDKAVSNHLDDIFKTSPQASRAAKALAKSLVPEISDTLIDQTIDALVSTWETEDAATGLAAFFAKTPPPWALDV